MQSIRLYVRYAILLIAFIGAFCLPGTAASQDGTVLRIAPAEVTADQCGLPVIAVQLENVTDLTAYSVLLRFDAQVLRVLEVSNGQFLTGEVPAPDNAVDNAAGTVRFGMVRVEAGDNPPESGSGDLVLLRVMALQPGQTAQLNIDKAETDLVGWTNDTVIDIPYEAENGIIHTGGCVTHNVYLPLIKR